MWWQRKPRDFKDEIDAHLQLEADELRSEGLTSAEAQAEAHRALGNRTSAEERFYESSRWMFGQHLVRDLRFATRVLRKEPKFSVLAILGLALGIGVSTAIMAFANLNSEPHGSGIRPPEEVRNPDSYVGIDHGLNALGSGFSFPEYRYFVDHATALEEVSAESEPASFVLGALSKTAESEAVTARFESASFLSVRGLHPMLGRSFSEEEEQTGAPVALLSCKFWQSHFAGDPGILGKTIVLNNHAVTIVGVADSRLHESDSSVVFLPLRIEPLLLDQGDSLHDSEKTWLLLSARLRPGVKLSQAQAEASLLAGAFDRSVASSKPANPGPPSQVDRRNVLVFAGTVPPDVERTATTTELAIDLIVSMILLIACSNLASLLLARATVRRRELGVRLSLGASRGRLICQLLTESLMLAMAGGGLGILFSSWLVKWLFLYTNIPGAEFHLDYRVLFYGVVLSLVTGFSFGFGPALAATKMNLAQALHAEGLAGNPSSPVQAGWSRRNLLVVIPLAASLMLLIGATLLMRGARSSLIINTAFDPTRVIDVTFRLKAQGYDEARTLQFRQDLRERIRAIPGVASVALASGLPPFEPVCRIMNESGVAAPGPLPHCNVVSPEFFETLSVPILRGRTFSSSDRQGSVPVAIVNQDFAREYWPDQEPIGKRVRTDSGSTFFEVIGVAEEVEDPKHLDAIPFATPTVYVPLGQGDLLFPNQPAFSPFAVAGPGQADQMQFLVRASGDPTQVKALLRQAVRTADSALWVNIQTIEESQRRFVRPLRTMTVMFSAIGSLVLLMASVGICAMLAYSVSQRTREIGIRMALGARNREILALVMRRTVILIAWGIGLGLAGALALAKILATLVFRAGPPDAVTCISVALLLGAVSLLASYLPARKALRVDPVQALRCE